MKTSRIKSWVKEETKRLNITEQELAKSLTNGAGMTPEWISYGSEWKDGIEIGTLLYDEILDQKWVDSTSLTDRYLIEKD
jgi:hypothetical protein